MQLGFELYVYYFILSNVITSFAVLSIDFSMRDSQVLHVFETNRKLLSKHILRNFFSCPKTKLVAVKRSIVQSTFSQTGS